MKQNSRKLISVIVLILLVGLLFYYLKNHASDFKELSVINPIYLIPLLLLSLLNSFTNGLVIKYLAEPFGIKLKFKEWFGLSVITSFYNMVTPFKGGLAAKSIYLKKKHNFSYADSLASIAGLFVLNFFIGSLLGLLSLYLIYRKYDIFNITLVLIFLAFFIPLSAIIAFSPHFKQTRYGFINHFVRILNGWNVIRREKGILLKCFLVLIIQIVMNGISINISYHIMGADLDFSKSLFLCTISILSVLIQITPSGLGITEAVAVFSGITIGISPLQSLSASIVIRIVTTVIAFTLGPIYSHILLKHKPREHHENK